MSCFNNHTFGNLEWFSKKKNKEKQSYNNKI